MKDQLARRAGSVDLFGKRNEANAATFQFGHYPDQISQAAPEAVEPPYDEYVTRT